MGYKRFLVNLSENFSSFVNDISQIKSNRELNCLRTAASIADEIYAKVVPQIRPGVTELYIKELFDKYVSESSAQKLAFDTIIATGPNGAFPHAVPSSRHITQDDMVVIDFGVVYQHFHSDMTRTLLMDPQHKNNRLLYRLVYDAQALALGMVKSGVSIKMLDDRVREFFENVGYKDYFIHGLGHGVGLKIHEKPFINQKSTGTLKSNMVITIEPGIYLPGFGGVRIEDTVIVTEDGYELLTKSEKVFY